MRLFIAEKPSVAKAIAGERGQTGTGDDFLPCGTDTVTWCFGHMLEETEPDDDTLDDVPRHDSGKKVWRVDGLPIIPADWILQLKEDARKQLAMIGKLLEEASEIVNAGDPDREGRLLVDEVLEHFCSNKPARRARVSAQDAVSVKRGLAALKDNGTCFGWGDAARARQRADRIIGMNLRRAYTLRAQRKSVPNHTLRAERPHAGDTFLAFWRGQEDQAGIDSERRLGAEYKHEPKKPKLKGRPGDSGVRETSEEQ
ncbi:MAG: hypothetical protein JSR42_21000 [Proteobacteria bacterium]|nr:hypothetical protein [Pseudomonadota bacterium]